jgi:cobalt-zinc-cadmium efflux system outer membrane protein
MRLFLIRLKEAASMTSKSWIIVPGLLLLAGCTFPVRRQVDDLICDRGEQGYDLRPPKQDKAGKKENMTPMQDPKKKPTLEDRLVIPPDLPASDTKMPTLPKDKKDFKEQIEQLLKEHYPPFPKIDKDKDFPPGPDGKPLTLSDLQRIAFMKNPLLKQAASDIEWARGAAIQAGAYPNPTIGYQSVGAGAGGGPFVGMFLSQTIKTMGKLKLAQAAATMDLQNAEFAYRRAETDLLSSVRTSYYAVLVAQESVRANRGLVELTDEVYRVMVVQLRAGQVSPYEASQMGVFAASARTALLTARNARLLAWRQLAAAMGEPHMPATDLAGNIHVQVPRIDFEKALAHVLTKHTDVLTTAGTIEKARHNLRLQQVTPVPDVTVQATVLNDLTPPGPSRINPTVAVSVPLPVFDLNKGAIRQSQAALVRASEEPHRVQADLTARFSEAYRRYDENRALLQMYQKDILPKQVQAFRLAVKRYFGAQADAPGALTLLDVISAEQNLVTQIGNYLPVLQAQWQAVVDVSSFLQTNQIYEAADEINSAPAIDFEELLKLPCHHPCAPAEPAPTRDGFWMAPAQKTPLLLGPQSSMSPAAPGLNFAAVSTPAPSAAAVLVPVGFTTQPPSGVDRRSAPR